MVGIGIGGRLHSVTPSVEDRDHMDYPTLFDRDIIEHYQVDVSHWADTADETVESKE